MGLPCLSRCNASFQSLPDFSRLRATATAIAAISNLSGDLASATTFMIDDQGQPPKRFFVIASDAKRISRRKVDLLKRIPFGIESQESLALPETCGWLVHDPGAAVTLVDGNRDIRPTAGDLEKTGSPRSTFVIRFHDPKASVLGS